MLLQTVKSFLVILFLLGSSYLVSTSEQSDDPEQFYLYSSSPFYKVPKFYKVPNSSLKKSPKAHQVPFSNDDKESFETIVFQYEDNDVIGQVIIPAIPQSSTFCSSALIGNRLLVFVESILFEINSPPPDFII